MAETSNIAEIDHALRTIWDKAPLISTSISYQGGKPVSFAPVINPPAAETMIERIVATINNTASVADISGVQGGVLSEDPFFVVINPVEVARAALAAMREQTNHMLGCGGQAIEEAPVDSDDIELARIGWAAMIDAALTEQG